MIFALKVPSHPNVVRPIGVTMNIRLSMARPWAVMERTYGLSLAHYFHKYPGADRIGPVSPLLFTTFN